MTRQRTLANLAADLLAPPPPVPFRIAGSDDTEARNRETARRFKARGGRASIQGGTA